ncbi:kinase-like protein [Annulohypoxylon moriforme]|nr:kinase-like protein [Annulohypoxylon moriforme]
MPGRDPAHEGEYLKKYFDTDPRFQFVGIIGSGMSGAASHVRYNDPRNQSLKNFVVKRAINTPARQRELQREETLLRSLQGAMHIVQVLDISNNPLARPGTSSLPAIAGGWVILEYLENGSVGKFIENAQEMGIEHLPNRLIWRFALCLIKAAIAMAWPGIIDRSTVASERTPTNFWQGSAILHRDLHADNIMLADVLPDNEHRITPRLKVIDFGGATEFSMAVNSDSVMENVTVMGEIIWGLIMLNTAPLDQFGDRPLVLFRPPGPNQATVGTQAFDLVPFSGSGSKYPWLDRDLRVLVCQLLRKDVINIPDLRELDRLATDAVRYRDAAYYGNEIEEQDDTIQELWHEIVHWDGGGGGGGGNGDSGGSGGSDDWGYNADEGPPFDL